MNQNPKQLTHDRINSKSMRRGWCILQTNQINLVACLLTELRSGRKEISFADFKYVGKSVQNFALNPLT